MACAPPTLTTASMPHSSAATSTAGFARPSGVGAVHRTRRAQPAMRAGTASMTTVEGRGAEPAGTYSPTADMGRMIRSQRTPGIVSNASGCMTCAEWNSWTFAMAHSSAAICRAASERRAWMNSLRGTASASSCTPSKRSVYERSAASPWWRTALMISSTWAATSARDSCAGRASAARRSGSASWSHSTMRMRSGQHFLDRQHEHGARTGFLQALERLPEHVLATHRMHGDAVGATLQRHDGRGLRARQEPADLRQGAARGVQHEVLALAHLLHAIDAHQQPL